MSVSEPILNRAERRKRQTKARLLDATETLLYEAGYATLTVRAITDTADLGYGTFYLHFENLDDAVWAVMERTADTVNAQLIEHLTGEPPRRRAYLSWVYLFDFVRQSGDLFLEMFGRGGSAQLVQSYQNWLAATHARNMGDGAYQPHAEPPIVFQAQYMAGATLRVMCWWAENAFDHSPQDMATMIYQMTYQEPPPTTD